MFSKHRIEALSDAVFAIAMTLLILDIKVPAEVAPGELGHALRGQSHEWISFAITFALTSVFWSLQHRVFDLLDEVGRESLVITFVFLGFVTVLPFSTALWGHHITEPVAFMVYFLNQFLIAAALFCKLEVARRRGHVRLTPDSAMMRVRLLFVCALMAIASVASLLMPLHYLWTVIIPLALVGRMLRNKYRVKAAMDSGQPAPLHPVPAPALIERPHRD